MLVNALYNLVDTIFVGRGVGYLAIGGLTIAFPVQMLIMAVSLMIGVGGSSVVSRSLGAKNHEQAAQTAGNSFFLVSLLGFAIFILGSIFIDPLLHLFGATTEIFPYAKTYLRTIFVGTIYFPSVVASNNLIRAEGKAKIAMISMLIGAIANIFLDYLFIFPLEMGVYGAALATILSQLLSAIFVIVYFTRGHSTLQFRPSHFRPTKDILRQILTVGFASFARNAAGSLIVVIVNHLLVLYGGSLAISVYGVLQRFTRFLFMPLFGIVQGMQPIVGYNYGARKLDRVTHAVKLSIIVATIYATTTSLLAQAFPTFVIGLFSEEPELIEKGTLALRFVIAMVPLIGIQIVGAALFQALGKALPSLILTLSREILLFIPFVLILPSFLGLTGIWLAFPLADLFAILFTIVFLKKEMRRLEKGQIIAP
ncbi:MAG TPA: MATE family efflux transporter [Firmicutes bacterium]|jgi:putative MATE family efflux protein|nr:MATE family efflux transporter [Bacillota bacterium]